MPRAQSRNFSGHIELDPNDATAHHWFANHSLSATGQIEREITEIKRALELDPLSLIINTNVGQAYIYANRFDEAIAQLRKTVEMDESFYFAHWHPGLKPWNLRDRIRKPLLSIKRQWP